MNIYQPQSDLLALPKGETGSITCHDGYQLADGSSIKLAVLGNTPGSSATNSFGVRVILEFPTKDHIFVFNPLTITVTETADDLGGPCDNALLRWCKTKSATDLAALANFLVQRMRVTVQDPSTESDDLTVRFVFEVNLAADGAPARIFKRSMVYHANVIPGFFVPSSGKAALELEVASPEVDAPEAEEPGLSAKQVVDTLLPEGADYPPHPSW